MNDTYRLLTILLLTAALAEARRGTKTWANPMTFYAGPFALILVGQQLLIRDVPFGWRAGGLIVGSAVALLGGMIAAWPQSPPREAPDQTPPTSRLVYRAPEWTGTALIVLVYLVALVYLYQLNAIRSSGLSTQNGIFQRELYYKDYGESLVLRGSQALNYAGAFFVAFHLRTRRFGMLLVLPLVVLYLAQSVAGSSKLTAILGCLILIVASASNRPAELRRIRFPAVVAGVLVAILVGTVFSLVTTARSRGTADVSQTTTYALLGSPSALSEYLDGRALVDLDSGFGLTFGGLAGALGGSERTLGVYSTNVRLNSDILVSQTNIYSGFLAFLHDFGVAGTWVVMAGIGFASAKLTHVGLMQRLGIRGQVALALLNLFLSYLSINVLTYYNFFFLLMAMALPLGWLYLTPHQVKKVPLPASS